MALNIVLVGSKYPRNVGMVARALANFAVDQLILLSPQCEINYEAREGAAQGQKPLRQAHIYQTWDEFFASEPDGPRVAMSRRVGKKRQAFPMQEMRDWPELRGTRPIYLVFGAEDHGLSTADLENCHRSCYFELPGELKSMNLSHAVVYALSQIHDVVTPMPQESSETTELPDQDLRNWLDALNFTIEDGHWNAFTVLKQLIMKAAPTQKEVKLLHNVIQQTLRRLREK